MNTKQKLIMVVDDESEIRNIIKEILVEEGYTTLTAASAEEAKRLLAEHRPDLVFLDIWMPDQDGIELLKEWSCLLYTSPSPRDQRGSRMPSSA